MANRRAPPGFIPDAAPVVGRRAPPGFIPTTQRSRPGAPLPPTLTEPQEFLAGTDRIGGPMEKEILNRLATLNSTGDPEALAALIKHRAPGATLEQDGDQWIAVMPDGRRFAINREGMSPADLEEFGYALGAELPGIMATRRVFPQGIIPGAQGAANTVLGRFGQRLAAGGSTATAGTVINDALTSLGQSEAGVQRPLVNPDNAAMSGGLGAALEAVGGPIIGKIIGGPIQLLQGATDAFARKTAANLSLPEAVRLGTEVARRSNQKFTPTTQVLEAIGRNSKSGLTDDEAVRLAVLENSGAAPTVGMVTQDPADLGRESAMRAGQYGEEGQRAFTGAIEESGEGMRRTMRGRVRGDEFAGPPNLTAAGETAQDPAFREAQAIRARGNQLYQEARLLAAQTRLPADKVPEIRKAITDDVAGMFFGGEAFIPPNVKRELQRIGAIAEKSKKSKTTPNEITLGDLLGLRNELSKASQSAGERGIAASEALRSLDGQLEAMRAAGIIDPQAPGVQEFDKAREHWRGYRVRFGEDDAAQRITRAKYVGDPDDPSRNKAVPEATGEQVIGVLNSANAATNIANIYRKFPAGSKAGDQLRSTYRTALSENLMSGLMDGNKFTAGAGKTLSNNLDKAQKSGVLELVMSPDDISMLRQTAAALDDLGKGASDAANPSKSGDRMWTLLGQFFRNPRNAQGLAGATTLGTGILTQDPTTTLMLGSAPLAANFLANVFHGRRGRRILADQLEASQASLQRRRRRPGASYLTAGLTGAQATDQDD